VSGGDDEGGGADSGAMIRFNGLDVGTTNSGDGGSQLPSLNVDTRVQTIAQGGDEGLTAPTEAQVGGGPPPTPPVLSPVTPDDESIVEDPVQTGTGSYEIWRRKPKKPKS
jgi:hypothetical protein